MSDDPKEYAKRANSGMMLGYPVRIGGQDTRPDNGVGYHSTIKVFNPEKDHPHKVHELAQHLPLNAPDAKNTQIEPTTFKDRNGNDVHVLKLKGNSAEKIKEHNAKFSHMGDPQPYEYNAHISLDKPTWDKIKSSGAQTAHEAGIEFGNAELKRGPKTIKTYHHAPDSAEPQFPDHGDFTSRVNAPKTQKSEDIHGKKPLAKPFLSEAQRRWGHTQAGKEALGGNAGVHEWDEATKGKKLPERVGKAEPLEKGAIKNAGIALGMAGALAGGAGHAGAADRSPASIQHTKPQAPSYDHGKMLRTIAQVESNNGANTNHPVASNGELAFGKYGLMPGTIKDTIKGHKDLAAKHGKALALKGQQFQNYMHDNKGLEDVIADRHLSHMEHVLGKNPEHLGYGWLNGAQGTLNAIKQKKDIKNHWHVKKIRDAYGKVK